MNLYLLTQEKNHYCAYDACIVAANNEEEARLIHPDEDDLWESDDWCSSPEEVKVKLIGIAENNIRENTIVLASYLPGLDDLFYTAEER